MTALSTGLDVRAVEVTGVRAGDGFIATVDTPGGTTDVDAFLACVPEWAGECAAAAAAADAPETPSASAACAAAGAGAAGPAAVPDALASCTCADALAVAAVAVAAMAAANAGATAASAENACAQCTRISPTATSRSGSVPARPL